MGGLGNQMFQYAAGMSLAIRLNTPFKLDVSWFAQQQKRYYGLSYFDLYPSFATSVETDLRARIVDAGYAIRYVPDAFMHHKHAPSLHYRNEQRGLFDRFALIKNHAYFGLKFPQHSKDDPLEKVLVDSLDFAEEHRKCIDNDCKRGILTEEDVKRFSSYAEQALFEGLRGGLFRERKLLRPEKITEYSSPYKPFGTLMAPKEKISLCIINGLFDSPERDSGTAFDRELAFAAAALGHNVHAVTLGSHEIRVDFEEGIWVHHVVPSGPKKPPPLWLPHIPEGLWEQSRAMYEEAVRLSERQQIHIFQWAINGLEGVASLIEQRFVNVLSMLSISETASWQYSEKERSARIKRSREERAGGEILPGEHAVLAGSRPLRGTVGRQKIRADHSRLEDLLGGFGK